MKKALKVLLLLTLLTFISIQFIHPSIESEAASGDFEAPSNVKSIVKRACYDCHSNETQLRWYDQVQPAYSLVSDHINKGKKVLNFSNWKSLSPADQKAKLWESVNQIAAGAMPLKSYQLIHQNAKISNEDLVILKSYLLSKLNFYPADSSKIEEAAKQYHDWKKQKTFSGGLPQAPNGITYIPDYKNWQSISTTERFDNGTMRVIFGNDMAVKAIREKQINPWPDGTIFAKVAWEQIEDSKGVVHTGAFKQVEYMIKDSEKYASTKGWGWARFKTTNLIPYGKNAMFTTECINCHKPQSNTDFVFTLPVKH